MGNSDFTIKSYKSYGSNINVKSLYNRNGSQAKKKSQRPSLTHSNVKANSASHGGISDPETNSFSDQNYFDKNYKNNQNYGKHQKHSKNTQRYRTTCLIIFK